MSTPSDSGREVRKHDWETELLKNVCCLIHGPPNYPYQNYTHQKYGFMFVSKNRGTPKSSILIGFSIISHPFWGTPIFGNTHI